MRVTIEICTRCFNRMKDDPRILVAESQPLGCSVPCITCGRSVDLFWHCRCKVRNPRPKRTNAERRLELLADIRNRVPIRAAGS